MESFFDAHCDHVIGLWKEPSGESWERKHGSLRGKRISELEYDYPMYDDSDGAHHIGLHLAFLDKKICPHTRYKYCPYCGIEIPWASIRRRLRAIDESGF